MLSLLSESIKIAISSIISNKTRSLLTGLSIIIGISTVTLMGTLISGLDRGFDRSMDFLFSNENFQLLDVKVKKPILEKVKSMFDGWTAQGINNFQKTFQLENRLKIIIWP